MGFFLAACFMSSMKLGHFPPPNWSRRGVSDFAMMLPPCLRSSYFHPVIFECYRGQHDAQRNIDDDADGEGPEGLQSEVGQLRKTGREADAEKAEHEGPGA